MHSIQNADYPSEPPIALNMQFTYIIHCPLQYKHHADITRTTCGVLSTGNLTLGQKVILCLQSLQSFLPVFRQIRSSISRDSICEESRLPLYHVFFPFGCFLTLPLFEFCFQIGSFRVSFGLNRGCHCRPEPLGFVG